MPDSKLQAGVVADPADGHTHAVRTSLAGNVALCGAGSISRLHPGRFQPDAADACPACAALVDRSA